MSKIQVLPVIIQRRVNEKVLEATPIILEIALKKFDERTQINFRRKIHRVNINWHNTHKVVGRDHGCGCNYCLILFKYVNKKIDEHRLRRKVDNDWYEFRSHCNDYEALRKIREEWKLLKAQKDRIKIEVGF